MTLNIGTKTTPRRYHQERKLKPKATPRDITLGQGNIEEKDLAQVTRNCNYHMCDMTIRRYAKNVAGGLVDGAERDPYKVHFYF